MKNIKTFYEFLALHNFGDVAIDVAHNYLIFGTVLSTKPENVLELGIGSGYVTKGIMYALEYNGRGRLTSVDNWHDWKGKEPEHVKELRELGANVVAPVDEGEFVKNQPENFYDFLMSDGDHHRAGLWAEEIFRIVKPDGIIFVHDVNMKRYPSLKRYVELSKKRGLSYFVFSKDSRESEWCSRGLLMVINK